MHTLNKNHSDNLHKVLASENWTQVHAINLHRGVRLELPSFFAARRTVAYM